MSYILDALKKAEHERDLGRVPRLESMQNSAPSRRRGAVWLIAGALLINAVVLAWWLRPTPNPTPTQTAQPEVVHSVPRSAPVQPAARPSVASVPVVVPVPSVSVSTPVTTQPPVSAPAPVAPPAIYVPPRVTPEPLVETLPPKVASAPPLLRDLPAEFRALVPPLSLDVHVYSPTVSGRFVLINMKKYREGESLAEGPTIEEITTDGVILSYQGERFRIARP